MFNCTRIHDVGYYDDQAAEAARVAAEPGKPLAYYGDNEVDLAGVFLKLRHALASAKSPFQSIRTGAIADSVAIRRLAAGQDPRTGHQLIHTPRSDKRRKVVGYDLQISAPKAVSVLYALGSRRLRRAILSAHGRALLRALRYIEAQGLIITRTGARSQRHESASEMLAALYTHLLSRDLDPQIHTHAILLNICVRADGKIGAIDNHRLKQHGGAIAALYRCELAAILRAELGLGIERDKRNFKLPIIPDAIVRLFSKRRAAIEAAAEAAGIDTATDRSRAQELSFNTRARKKKGLSLTELTQDWLRQAEEAGFDHVSTLDEIETRLDREQPPAPATTAPAIDTQALIERIFENAAMRSWPQILCAIAEELQVSASADAALAMAETLRSSLVAVETTMEGDPIYTSEALVRAEHELLRMAHAGRGTWHGVSPALVESVLEKDTLLSVEQRDAVAHALGTDAVVAVEGPPGAGKSHMTAAIHTVAKAAGLDLRVTSVSWQATHVVRRDAGVATDRAAALTPLLHALSTGKLSLSARDIVIVDEAGMAGLAQVAALTRYCRDSGAKLVLVGDTRQLQPVAAGAPMRAITQLLGHGALHTIRRQEVAWMRQASMDLASGRAERAIDSYDAAGAIAVHATRDATLAAAADEYLSLLVSARDGLNVAMQRQLLITSRNDDVAELNRIVRQELKKRSRLGADEMVVSALRRDMRGDSPIELPLSRGDRIILGERVELGDITLYNADTARVVWIEPGRDGPVVTLALDRLSVDGATISLTRPWKDLVSTHRKSAFPVAQHAYATTVHASQGATVEHTIVAMATAMKAEPLFVAMTRHRKSLSMHVDAAIGQQRDTTAGIALSRSGRLRGTDEAPEPAQTGRADAAQRETTLAALKQQALRSSPIDNPSRYVSDIKSWIAAEDAVAAFRRQLAVGKPLAAFKTRLQHLMTSGRSIRFRSHDPLALSPLERQQLDRVPLTANRISRSLGLIHSLNDLRHPATGERLQLRGGKPQWSLTQARRIATAKASDEHVIVQIAIAILLKSVQAARALVRAAFRLARLNPLARAVARRTRQRATMQQPVSVLNDIGLPPLFSSHQTRQVADERDEAEDRERDDSSLRLAAEWHRLQAPPAINAGKDSENTRQHTVNGPRLDHLPRLESVDPVVTANTSNRIQTAFSDQALDDILSRLRLSQQQQDDEEKELRERQQTLLMNLQAPLTRESAPEVAAAVDVGQLPSKVVGRLQTAGEIEHKPPSSDKAEPLSDGDRDAKMVADIARTPAVPRNPGARDSNNPAGAVLPAALDKRASVDRATYGAHHRQRTLEESKSFRDNFLQELDQRFEPIFTAARGNPLDPRAWGDATHIVRVSALKAGFEALKSDAKNAFASLVRLQLDKSEFSESDQTTRHNAERQALATIYRSLMPTIDRPFKADVQPQTGAAAEGGLPPAQAEELLARTLALRTAGLDIPVGLKLAATLKPFVDAPFPTTVLLARAQGKAMSMEPEGVKLNDVREWAENAGGLATSAADALLHALAHLPDTQISPRHANPTPEVGNRGRDPAER